jgi:hypothetical protein
MSIVRIAHSYPAIEYDRNPKGGVAKHALMHGGVADTTRRGVFLPNAKTPKSHDVTRLANWQTSLHFCLN